MTVGKRIRFFRELRGMTQQQLGEKAGFPAKTAGVRMAQYETGSRTPREALQQKFADALGVSVCALAIPGLNTPAGIMHTLFALEDLCGLQIAEIGEELVLRFPSAMPPGFGMLRQELEAWARRRAAMDSKQLAKKDYDQWRYGFTGTADSMSPDPGKGA